MSISLGDDFCSLSLGLLDDLSLNKSSFSGDLIILKLSLSVDLVDKGVGIGLPFTLDSFRFGFNSFDFFLFFHLGQLSLFLFIFSLFQMDLFGFLFFFKIVCQSLVESKSFSFQSCLELIDGCFLHGISDLWSKCYLCNHYSLNLNSFVLKTLVQELHHTLSMSCSS